VGYGLLIGNPLPADAGGFKGRKCYLTQNLKNGSQALTACVEKFHMASLWEIFNTSNLGYDTSRGFTQVDSGSGPPAGF